MNAVQCDQCGTFAANPVGRARDGFGSPALPDGWLNLFAGNRDSASQEVQIQGEFCGTKCAGKYLTVYVPKLVPRGPT